MPDDSRYPCANCGGTVDPDAESHDGQGHDGDVWWCSEICRQVVVEGKWPSSYGPATHDEMVGWVTDERAALSNLIAERIGNPKGDPTEIREELEALIARGRALPAVGE